MTEDKAKTKWCPMVRVMNHLGTGGGNRWDGASAKIFGGAWPSGGGCVGSDCMMWRKQTEVQDLQASLPALGAEWRMVREYGQGGAVTHRKVWEADGGYCGLAGRP